MLRLDQLALAVAALALAMLSWIVSGWWLTPRGPGEIQITAGDGKIGGAFTLVDATGRTVTDRDLRGRPFIVYFGWTRDPDLTPAALQLLDAALAAAGGGVVPVFVTLDPEHDTPARLAAFTAKHSPALVALTGAAQQTGALATAYRLYWKRIPEPSLPVGYSIDHASQYYVMGSDGEFRGHIPHTTDRAELAREILRLLRN